MVAPMEIFHNRLSEFMTKLSLVSTSDPKMHDMFWWAKDAVYQNRMNNVVMSTFYLIPSMFRIVGTILVLMQYHFLLVLLALLSILPSTIIRWIYEKKSVEVNMELSQKQRSLNYILSLLTQKEPICEMRTMGFGEHLSNKYFKKRTSVFKTEKHFAFNKEMRVFLCDLSKLLFYALSIVFCIRLLSNGQITIGIFGACLAAFLSMQNVALSFLSNMTNLRANCEYSDNYYRFFDLDQDSTYIDSLDEPLEYLQAKNLSFKFPTGNENVINNINLSIKRGEKIVIVGENGSGKTTLVKLLLGLYEPTNGEIIYNNHIANNLSKEDLFKQFSLSAQNFMRYNMTLKENIAIGDFANSDDENKLTNALKFADIEDIATNIGGLDQELGTSFGGIELSGGQWQKISIARAAFRNRAVMFLDEPTSALDPLIECEILERFIEMSKDKTTILISHRVGICRMADRIIVMRDGEIIEQGTHKDLLESVGEYTRIWNEQAKWYAQ